MLRPISSESWNELLSIFSDVLQERKLSEEMAQSLIKNKAALKDLLSLAVSKVSIFGDVDIDLDEFIAWFAKKAADGCSDIVERFAIRLHNELIIPLAKSERFDSRMFEIRVAMLLLLFGKKLPWEWTSIIQNVFRERCGLECKDFHSYLMQIWERKLDVVSVEIKSSIRERLMESQKKMHERSRQSEPYHEDRYNWENL
jgi:hypothetical protein